MSEKTAGEELQSKLIYKQENAGIRLSDEEIQKSDEFCEEYKVFLSCAKTEREAVSYFLNKIKAIGYTEFDAAKKYKAGDKVYYNNRDKALIIATIGTEPVSKGVRILASHIDSPRLDLKGRPLYEEGQIALLKTHYYGGIKKYQWAAIPLALHGVIIKKDGTKLEVKIGEDKGDPVFCVTDLLPHLATEQMQRKVSDAIKGEELNILVGCRPFKDDKASEKVKLNIMKILNEKYGIIEADFLSAELTAVPAFDAVDVGFDKSMVGSYGHDDRVCAYTSFMAAIGVQNPQYTHITAFADKEEVGSAGNTGLDSSFLKYFIEDLAEGQGCSGRTVLSKSECLSADVTCAFDPTFPNVSEKNNTSYLNYGVAIMKYTGSRGKSGTSDASAEFMGRIRKLLDDNNIIWQTGELGKVDEGGGGTVAKYVAGLNADVVDVGVPVLSMHAPFEVVSKIDVYMTYRAFEAFISK